MPTSIWALLFINPSQSTVDLLGAADGPSPCIFLQHFEENFRVFKKIMMICSPGWQCPARYVLIEPYELLLSSTLDNLISVGLSLSIQFKKKKKTWLVPLCYQSVWDYQSSLSSSIFASQWTYLLESLHIFCLTWMTFKMTKWNVLLKLSDTQHFTQHAFSLSWNILDSCCWCYS